MNVIPSVSDVGSQSAGGTRDLRDLDMGQFLDLLIAELQNQDPLSPMENSEMLQQISMIREISSTNQLTETLTAVLTGQNLTTASTMIGKAVKAISDTGELVEGVVDSVSIEVDEDDENQRTLRVHIGQNAIDINNVRNIVSTED